MKLYGTKISPYFGRIWLQGLLKQLPMTLVEGPPEDIIPEAMKLRNPIGKIPFLVDGERLYFESEVICEYLEDRYPVPPLWPSDPDNRARARLLTRILDLYILQPTHRLAAHLGAPRQDEVVIDRLFAEIRKGLYNLGCFLEGGPYATGTTPVLSDCALAAGLWYLPLVTIKFRSDDLREGDGRVEKYWAFVRRAPVFCEAIGEMDGEMDMVIARQRSAADAELKS